MGILNRKKTKPKYYSSERIRQENATYYMIYGKRSNGKTYDILSLVLKNYIINGKQSAYIRRWQTDFNSKTTHNLFNGLVKNGVITDLTNGQYNAVRYYARKWYLCFVDDEGNKTIDDMPFMIGFLISEMESDKSASYDDVTLICFDEFISRDNYIVDEFVAYMNVISTIVRNRTDVTIFMLGNTVNKYCPYFKEMGITRYKDMQAGDIQVYDYGESGLRVAVEYADADSGGSDSNFYFAFDNPKLKMITGGAWELEIYPHAPCKYKQKDICFNYFIDFDGELLQCDIVTVGDNMFTYIHQKTTPLKHPDDDLVYSPIATHKWNYKRNILKASNKVEQRIIWFFKFDKVFYQDNEVGELVRNYLLWCKQH